MLPGVIHISRCLSLSKGRLGVCGFCQQHQQVGQQFVHGPVAQIPGCAVCLGRVPLRLGGCAVLRVLAGQAAQLPVHHTPLEHGVIVDLLNAAVRPCVGVCLVPLVVLGFADTHIAVSVLLPPLDPAAGDGRHGVASVARVGYVRRGIVRQLFGVVVRVQSVILCPVVLHHGRVVVPHKPHIRPGSEIEHASGEVHGRRCHTHGVVDVFHQRLRVWLRDLHTEPVPLRPLPLQFRQNGIRLGADPARSGLQGVNLPVRPFHRCLYAVQGSFICYIGFAHVCALL